MSKKEKNCANGKNIPLVNSLNVVSQATSLSGNMKTKDDFRVDGKMFGNIECQGRVVIGIEGHVDGNIHADSVDLYGKQDGDIHAVTSCILRASSIYRGKILTAMIEVEAGADFHGDCEINNADVAMQIA